MQMTSNSWAKLSFSEALQSDDITFLKFLKYDLWEGYHCKDYFKVRSMVSRLEKVIENIEIDKDELKSFSHWGMF